MYRFHKNEEQEPCFRCSNLDEVIDVANAIVLAMYLNDVEGYVTVYDRHGAYTYMVNTDEVPHLYGFTAISALTQECIYWKA